MTTMATTNPGAELTTSEQTGDGSHHPTIWGLTPLELHDRFWATRGVQVVRPGRQSELVEDAELFLLIDPHLLTLFRVGRLVERLSWLKPDIMWVRLQDQRERGYREVTLAGEDGAFQGIRREYGATEAHLSRVAVTSNPAIARRWQDSRGGVTGWRELRDSVPRSRRLADKARAQTFNHEDDDDVMRFMHVLMQYWPTPNATVDRARRVSQQVWRDESASVSRETRFIGSAWVGAGRNLDQERSVVGPAVLWDDPASRPAPLAVNWQELEPDQSRKVVSRSQLAMTRHRLGKRVFDIAFAGAALVATAPLFPAIMVAIWREDGRPFLFAHERESRGGRPFKCLKFRSMRHDAEAIKQQLIEQNQVDGPQFYIDDDPRLTRVGKFLRRYHLDELPQLINVLKGEMSIVGPRPSPYEENQYAPSWREARLSVLPGITGLWQVKRTREEGRDFQEWIRYDLEYVERASFRLDLWIIGQTMLRLLKR